MGKIARQVIIRGTILLLLHAIFSPLLLAQATTPFMTLIDGTKVSMTQAQYDALVKQPGITYSLPSEEPRLAATQIAIPVPAELGPRLPGGGFIFGEPSAIAGAMNAVGITSTATAAGLIGGKSAVGGLSRGTAVPAASSSPR